MRLLNLYAAGLLGICLGLMASCAGAIPTTPQVLESDQCQFDSGRISLGVYNVRIDLISETADVKPIRLGSQHFNVTQFLVPPVCSDCFIIEVINLDWDNYEVTADVTVRNFTLALTGYDVRGIVYPLENFILKNPYAYTLLHAPVSCEDIAGFRAYDTADPDRAMLPSESATETYVIGFQPGAIFLEMVYAIDASWPDHCPEPYDMYNLVQDSLNIVVEATTQVTVNVSDWQEDTGFVTIDTDILGGLEIDLSHVSGEIWTGTVTNVLGMPVGFYPCLITAKDQPTLNQLFQWVEIEISDLSDHDPPTWDSEEGITGVNAGLSGILVDFGHASDPSEPVTYNLYWVEGGTLDFGTANKVSGIEGSPYLLTGLNAGLHTLCLRAEDGVGNETTNVDFESAIVGEYPNVWWTSGPNMDIPRGYAGGFIANGYFWVLGGSATGTQFDVVERFDLAAQTWDSPWSLPEPRDAFGCGTLDGLAFIFGGRFSETNVTDTCHVIDLETGACILSPPTYPMPMANMGCAILDDTIYLAGGRDFTGAMWEFFGDAFSFTPPGPDFGDETDLAFTTSTMGFAAGDGYLMSCGGHPDRDDVLYHIPSTGSWESRAPIVPGRDGNVSVWVDGWFYSIGGNVGPNIITNVDVLDVVGDTWYSISPLLHARGVAVAATDGAYIYVAGGVSSVTPIQIPLASLEIGRIY